MNAQTRVVVTGIGVQTSIGCTRAEFWQSLVNGRSGVALISSYDPTGQPCRIASEVRGFNPLTHIAKKLAGRMARNSQLAACAAADAVKDAGLELGRENPIRVGCVIGSAAGDYLTLDDQYRKFLEKGPGALSPFAVPKIIPNMPGCNVAIVLGIEGPNFGAVSACATGSHSIGMALNVLRAGQADVMLAGGTESTITSFVVNGYANMGVLSRQNDAPASASRPFDKRRDGFVIGEGAGVLVLETLDHARARGAEPLAELAGFGMTCDAYSIALPEPDGRYAAAAMQMALDDAKMSPAEIHYVNAHGTSTVANDRTEARAVTSVFGSAIPVSSNKSMIGHTLGAAGAIEAAATVLTVRHDLLPPTINFEEPDDECALDVVPNSARESRVGAAISNSFGFGGQNGVLLFRKI
jgi:3-oxoacyl-[acyl-carrier-protein] synthase II